MKRFHCIVEGQTEVAVFTSLLTPYIFEKTGAYCLFTPIKHTGGGIVQFSKILPELREHLKEKKIVTTYFDYYGIHESHKFKFYNEAKIEQSNAQIGVDLLEKGMSETLVENGINTRYFIPYIQLHEFEALLFSSSDSFELVYENKKITEEIQKVNNRYPNPEDINDSPKTAPSKRIIKIVEKYHTSYEKVVDGEDLATLTSLETIMDKCPRFKNWVDKITIELNNL